MMMIRIMMMIIMMMIVMNSHNNDNNSNNNNNNNNNNDKLIQVNLDMTDHCTTDFCIKTEDMLGPSPMHIKYSSYVHDGFCI